MPQPRPATVHDWFAAAPQRVGDGASTWIARGANFVVALSKLSAGAALPPTSAPDESMVFVVDARVDVECERESFAAGPQTLVIVPPGPQRIRSTSDGMVVQVFSERADMAAFAANAAAYADPVADVAPLRPWPDPPGGFRLRSYRMADVPGQGPRIFRCTNLMINILAPRLQPRDTTKLSPHSHDDFEQGSLALQGSYLHHVRYPWSADLSSWREDDHLEAGSPSLAIIPPKAIHTSRNLTAPGWLIDIFAPPRADFSLRPGAVLNAADYPAPAGLVSAGELQPG